MTGYTSQIKENTTFKEFALICTRAFGICAELRDTPLSAEIPKFKADNYYSSQLEIAKDNLRKIEDKSIEECESSAKADYEENIKIYKNLLEESIKQLDIFNKMLEKVKSYQPTKDYISLKEFMMRQLEETIHFEDRQEYCKNEIKNTKLLNGKEWKEQNISKAKENIKYFVEQIKEETQSARYKNKWIQNLIKSL